MFNTDENSAREFLAYRRSHANALYSMSSRDQFCVDDDFLETVEMFGSNKEVFLQNNTSLMND
jgi:hypothetical protein